MIVAGKTTELVSCTTRRKVWHTGIEYKLSIAKWLERNPLLSVATVCYRLHEIGNMASFYFESQDVPVWYNYYWREVLCNEAICENRDAFSETPCKVLSFTQHFFYIEYSMRFILKIYYLSMYEMVMKGNWYVALIFFYFYSWYV